MLAAPEIRHNLETIEGRITAACQRAGRQRSDVRLLLATKTVVPENIKIAFDAGYYLMGENKVQEIKEKFELLKDVPHETHFIGHLQSNKIKDILRYNVSCIQSVDRISLAEKLQKRLEFENKTINVLVQVNTSNEESKFGIAPEKAAELVRSVAAFSNIKIKGLMTIGLFDPDAEKTRPCFRLLKAISEEIKAMNIPGIQMEELSMGMSGDLETAIEEGATIVRVGTSVFGKRMHPGSYYWNENK